MGAGTARGSAGRERRTGASFEVTDANGVYRVLGAPAGTVRVCFDGSGATGGSVDASGYEAECQSNEATVATADAVTVAAGSTTNRIGTMLPQ